MKKRGLEKVGVQDVLVTPEVLAKQGKKSFFFQIFKT